MDNNYLKLVLEIDLTLSLNKKVDLGLVKKVLNLFFVFLVTSLKSPMGVENGSGKWN